ncbi:toprim domain-containing protein [Thiomonas sp.]
MSIAHSASIATPTVNQPAETPGIVLDILQAAGLPVRTSGSVWLRAPATWRGSADYNLAIHAETGAWRLHSTGEHGSFADLLELLGLDPETGQGLVRPGQKAASVSRKHTATTQGQALALWRQAFSVSDQGDYRPPFPELREWREAAMRYLRGRGIPNGAVQHAARYLRIIPEPASEKGLLLLVPLYAPELGAKEPTGLQRIRIDRQGNRFPWKPAGGGAPEAKRMIGPRKLGPNEVSTGWLLPPLNLAQTDPLLLICEGPETAIALQAITGAAVWCLTSADGLDRARIEFLKELGIRRVCVAGDHDPDGRGQTAAAHLGQRLHARFPDWDVTLALPPQAGEDWLDILAGQGAEQALVLFRQQTVEVGDPPDPENPSSKFVGGIPASVSNAGREVPVARNWRPSVQAEVLPVGVPVAVAQRQVIDRLVSAVRAQAQWQENIEDGTLPAGTPLPGSQVLEVTTGTGKSRALLQLAHAARQRRVPVFVLTANLDLAQSVAADIGGVLHRGRQYAPGEAHHCHQAGKGGTVARLGEARRQVRAIGCVGCPHQARNELDKAQTPARRQEIEDQAQRNGWQAIRTYDHCDWLDAQAREAQELIVVGAKGSVSPALTQYRKNGKSWPRLLLVDEETDLMDAWSVEQDQSADWLQRVRQEITRLSQATYRKPEQARKAQDWIDWLKQAEPVLEQLIRMQADSVTGGICSLTDWPEWRRLADLAPLIQDAAVPHERASAVYGQPLQAPLRGFVDLGWGLAHQTVTLENGVLHCRTLSATGKLLLQREHTLVFLNATPSRALGAAVRAQGGQVDTILVEQNIDLIEYPQRAHLRGGFQGPDGPRRLALEKARLEVARNLAGPGMAVVTHRPLAEEPLQDGYYGRDHLGHNRYTGRPLVLFGDPLAPPDELRRAYLGDRALALAAGASESDWPGWAPERVTNAWVPTGTEEVQSRVALPADPRIRDWWLEQVERILVQGVGRVRGARAQQRISVYRFGGIPVRWHRYGLRAERREDPAGMGRSRQEWALSEQRGAIQRTWQAIVQLEEKRMTVSRRNIAKTQEGLGMETLSPGTYQRFLAWAKRHRPQPGPEHLMGADLFRMMAKMAAEIEPLVRWPEVALPTARMDEVAAELANPEPGSIADDLIRTSVLAWHDALRALGRVKDRAKMPAAVSGLL